VRARNVTDGSYLVFVPPDRARASVTATGGSFLAFERVTAAVAGTYAAKQTRFDVAADLALPRPPISSPRRRLARRGALVARG
jgi:hypothetical protein